MTGCSLLIPVKRPRCSGCAAPRSRASACVAQQLQQRFGGSAVLKGAGGVVASDGSPTSHLQRRQPGMASGGMGDALTGVMPVLMAQGMGCATRPSGVCHHLRPVTSPPGWMASAHARR